MKTKTKTKTEPNRIERFIHCGQCIDEVTNGVPLNGGRVKLFKSPREHASLEVGFTGDGRIQVWCKRHERHVGYLDPKDPPALACGHGH